MAIRFIIKPEDQQYFDQNEGEIISQSLGSFFNLPELEIEVIILTLPEIRQLNQDQRGIDEPTDVLSFPLFENITQIQHFHNENSLLIGDIYICPEKVALYGESMLQMLHHGSLHLLGFDHVTDFNTWHSQESELLALYAKSGLIIEGVTI